MAQGSLRFTAGCDRDRKLASLCDSTVSGSDTMCLMFQGQHRGKKTLRLLTTETVDAQALLTQASPVSYVFRGVICCIMQNIAE